MAHEPEGGKVSVDRPRRLFVAGIEWESYVIKGCEELALVRLVCPLVGAGDDRGVTLDQPPRIRRQPRVGPAKLLCGPLHRTSVETLGVPLGELRVDLQHLALREKVFPALAVPKDPSGSDHVPSLLTMTGLPTVAGGRPATLRPEAGVKGPLPRTRRSGPSAYPRRGCGCLPRGGLEGPDVWAATMLGDGVAP